MATRRRPVKAPFSLAPRPECARFPPARDNFHDTIERHPRLSALRRMLFFPERRVCPRDRCGLATTGTRCGATGALHRHPRVHANERRALRRARSETGNRGVRLLDLRTASAGMSRPRPRLAGMRRRASPQGQDLACGCQPRGAVAGLSLASSSRAQSATTLICSSVSFASRWMIV